MLPFFLGKNKFLLVVLFGSILLLVGWNVLFNNLEDGSDSWRRETEGALANMKYLVKTEHCKIPDIEPFNIDIDPYFKKEDRINCSNLELLTFIDKVGDDVYLKVRSQLVPLYTDQPISCCYSNITRGNVNNMNVDYGISFSGCAEFKHSVKITSDLVKVECTSSVNGDKVYENVHSVIKRTEGNKKRPSRDGYSVMFFGIDSMSRLNFMRTMPRTYKLLESSNWTNLPGYNKINDNTFSNVMGALTGMNREQTNSICDPDNKRLDDCDMIFKQFNDAGYVTATGEDESYLNTFNYYTVGFEHPPTNFYFRPYYMAVETLKLVTKYLASFCTGPQSSGERMVELAKDFSEEFRNSLKFSFFWTTTFSHNNLNMASAMDEIFEEFFNYLMCDRLLERTIVVFYSDHGFRFGKMRYTYTGSLEERLPFNYIWLPESFKKEQPERYQRFQENSRKLITPYDIYMTLQDLITITNSSFKAKQSIACPKCVSLFQPMEDDRTCNATGIPEHFCTCFGHFFISPRSKIVQKASLFALDYLNNVITSFEDGSRMCEHYDLKHTVSAGITENFYNTRNESSNYLRVIFETFPKGAFEASVKVTHQGGTTVFEMEGEISRVDRYGDTSSCIKDKFLRKYCHCKNLYVSLKKTVDILFNN